MADEVVKKVTVKVGAEDNSKGVLEQLGDRLDKIKRTFGGRGLLKELTEVAVGGGAVAGLSFITRSINDMATRFAELDKLMKESGASAAQISVELGKSLPIIGSLVSAGQTIREILTGEKAEIDQILSQARLIDESVKSQKESWKGVGEAIKGLRQIGLDFSDPLGPRDSAVSKISEEAEKARQKARDEAQKRNAPLRDQLRALDAEREQLEGIPGGARTKRVQDRLAAIPGDIARFQALLNVSNRQLEKQLAGIGGAASQSMREVLNKAAIDNYDQNQARDKALIEAHIKRGESDLSRRLAGKSPAEQADILRQEAESKRRPGDPNAGADSFVSNTRREILQAMFDLQEFRVRRNGGFPGFASLEESSGSGANDSARENIRLRFENESLEVQKQTRDAVTEMNKTIAGANSVFLGVF